jgi:type II secretory pathway predicted ATPase ExeA
MTNYKSFFGFAKEPFGQDLRTEDFHQSPQLIAAAERFQFAVQTGAVCVITGEVGSGKSSALRYGSGRLHPSQYRVIPVIASTGSVNELLKQICFGLGVESKSLSISTLMKTIRALILEIAARKQTPVLLLDEANLLRLEVFAQLHTLAQFELDSKPVMPMILAGQNALLDKLRYHTSRPLASRVVARSHLDGLKQKDTSAYLKHHLELAGLGEQLFSEEAVTAIHQSAGGLLRKMNILARGSLIAATREQCRIVSAEHVRLASTEVI